MAGLMNLRVKALRPSRRRAGFAFTPEFVDLTRDDFEEDYLAALTQFRSILSDPQLLVLMVEEDGSEKSLTEDELQELRAVVEQKWAEANLQPASGVEGEAGTDASAPADLSISGDGSADSDTSQSLPGTGTSSAGEPGQPREETDASNGAAASDADGGKQPADTSLPPVAEPNAASEKGPSAVPAAEKSAGKAKPKGATQTRA